MYRSPIISKKTCQQWIKALRSGKFKQGTKRLRSGNQHGTRFCCLGVLNEISDYPAAKGGTEVQSGPTLPYAKMCTLIKYNDGGKSFDEIADHIERYTLPHCPEKEVDKLRVF
jgi:hypothetical protein